MQEITRRDFIKGSSILMTIPFVGFEKKKVGEIEQLSEVEPQKETTIFDLYIFFENEFGEFQVEEISKISIDKPMGSIERFGLNAVRSLPEPTVIGIDVEIPHNHPFSFIIFMHCQDVNSMYLKNVGEVCYREKGWSEVVIQNDFNWISL